MQARPNKEELNRLREQGLIDKILTAAAQNAVENAANKFTIDVPKLDALPERVIDSVINDYGLSVERTDKDKDLFTYTFSF